MESRERTKKAVEPAAEDVAVYEGSSAAVVVAMVGGRFVKEERRAIFRCLDCPEGLVSPSLAADEARREFRKGGARRVATSAT